MEYTEQQDASENRYTPLETLDPKELEGWTARELFFGSEQSDTDSSTDSRTDTALSESDDFDPWALFFSDEITPGSDSDPVLDNRTETKADENTGFSEQAFLSALQSDGESGTITNNPETEAQKPLTAQERLAMLGTALLDMGGMPSDQQLSAMGMDKPTARGIQSLVLLSKENSPAARRAVEAMIDATAGGGEFSGWSGTPGDVITDGSHLENGRLKPNISYKTGEHDYFYETNADGFISRAYTSDLQLKVHDGRLEHNPNTYGKQAGDHAGHLFGDRFGGSPELDNLVSQARMVNLSEYKTIENQWANALKNGQTVTVDIKVNYESGSSRPSSFEVSYTIDGIAYARIISNGGDK